MINLTKKKFNKFPNSNKAMIYLMWIFTFWHLISTLFISIFIFKFQSDISHVITYNIIFFISCFIWFSWIWYIYSVLQKNVKSMYYISYFLLIISYIYLLLFNSSIIWIYIFWLLHWAWFWVFWSVVHANELTNIKDKDRDFYSSLISAWWNILQIITPLLVSIVFIFWNYIDFDWYYILFIIIPIVYLISFLFIKDIWDYVPSMVKKKDFTNFFNLKKYFWWQSYIFFSWATFALRLITVPIIAILLLKSEINVWIFESIMWAISVFIVLYLSHIRNKWNRLRILLIITTLLLLAYLLFTLYFNVFWYIIFSLILIILLPLYRVSEHVYDLKIMDSIKAKGSDFFPSMLFREFTINFARISVLLIWLYLTDLYGNDLELLLKILLIITWFMYLLTWFSIKMHVIYENHENIKNLD